MQNIVAATERTIVVAVKYYHLSSLWNCLSFYFTACSIKLQKKPCQDRVNLMKKEEEDFDKPVFKFPYVKELESAVHELGSGFEPNDNHVPRTT
jgi:hypothetical protein